MVLYNLMLLTQAKSFQIQQLIMPSQIVIHPLSQIPQLRWAWKTLLVAWNDITLKLYIIILIFFE